MNERQIRYTFELLKEENELIEVRAITPRTNYSGYFKSVDLLVSQISKINAGNVYFVLNKISDACYSRDQHDCFIEKAKNTTSDNDIVTRQWFLVDVDPKRATGVSSSDDEKNAAKKVVNNVFAYLRDLGFSEPIICDSGNGFHLLYRINIDNTDQNKMLLQKMLQVLDMYFSTPKADIDKTVFNAARITKLYGTDSKKGNSTIERPHRESCVLRSPKEIKETPYNLLLKLSQQLPEKEKKSFENNYGNDNFDIDTFISKNNIEIYKTIDFNGGKKHLLSECIFDSNHKNGDAAIFILNDGSIGYKCFHNSCSQYTWKDVRLKYEPNAYQNKNNFNNNRVTEKKQEIKPKPIEENKGDKFLTMQQIKSKDRSQIVSMPSGFKQMDKMIIGFNKGEISLWSGKNGSAKSTIINQLSINAIEKGFKGIIFSGELPAHKMKHWISLQCAGRQYVTASTRYENVYFVKDIVSQKIDSWLNDKLYVYNNEYGNNFEQLLCELEDFVVKKDIDFIVLDNLMALDLLTLEGDKYQQQTKFINMLCSFVRKFNIHLHIVAHPRKQTGFLRKDDISGTADLTNAVDNVFICHRNNNDYKKAIAEFYPKQNIDAYIQHDNYIEICKNRDMGIIDLMVGLYFERESKRLLNEQFDNMVYSWQENPVQQEIQKNDDFYNTQPNLQKDKSDDPFGDDISDEKETPF